MSPVFCCKNGRNFATKIGKSTLELKFLKIKFANNELKPLQPSTKRLWFEMGKECVTLNMLFKGQQAMRRWSLPLWRGIDCQEQGEL